MARDELIEMTHDKWPASVWDATLAPSAQNVTPSEAKIDRPKLFFYWGANDYWVDNGTRDSIIASRAGTERPEDQGKPRMEIDRVDTPHDFCISK